MLVAFALYIAEEPFGRLHGQKELKLSQCADAIGRTPSALAMKLVNIASLDPAITTIPGVGDLRAASDHVTVRCGMR